MTKTSEPEVWDRHAIKAAIGRKGLTMMAIARMSGIESWQVRHGLRGNNRTGAEAIARALGKPFRTLFPDSYLSSSANALDTTRNAGESTRKNGVPGADLMRSAS